MDIIVIPGRFPSLNQHDYENRRNRFKGASMKKEATDMAYWVCKKYKVKEPYSYIDTITFTWYRRDKSTDKDNISFAKKYILDGMVKAGILKDDGWDNIGDFKDKFLIDGEERVEIELKNA